MQLFVLLAVVILGSGIAHAQRMTSEEFKYSKVYTCGPEKYDGHKVNNWDLYKYYLIHFDDQNNVVILNDKVQYQSFETINLSKLYFQNGGQRSLEVTAKDGVYIFELLSKGFRYEDVYFVKTLIFNETNLTYQVRNTDQNLDRQIIHTYTTKSGFCYLEDIG